MAKKLCELCQQAYESDMRFGIRMCQNCLGGYSKAMSGDVDAIVHFSNVQNFPNATEAAQIHIIGSIVKRVERLEAKEQEKRRDEQHQQEVEKIEYKRETYAKSVGVTDTEKVDNNTESTIDGLYIDIGKKIKGWAKWIFIIEAIVAVMSAIIMLFNIEDVGEFFAALAVLVFGPMIAWVSSWILYAFGELVDKTVVNEKNTQNILKLMCVNNIKDNDK